MFKLGGFSFNLKEEDFNNFEKRNHFLLSSPLHNHFLDLLSHFRSNLEVLTSQDSFVKHFSNIVVLGDEDDRGGVIVDNAVVEDDEEVLDELAFLLEGL